MNGVNARRAHLFPNARTHGHDGLQRPAEIGKQAQHPILQAHVDVRARPGAQLLQRRIARPGAQRPAILLLAHVLEAGALEEALHPAVDEQLVGRQFRGAELAHRVPLRDGRVRGDAAVVADEVGRVLHLLEEAAGLERAEALRVQLRAVAHGGVGGADVDEVEAGLAERPLVVEVVDLELAVRRHPVRLDGRQVGADHAARGEVVGEVDGPDARAGAEVEDFFHIGRDRREVELAVERFGEEVVREVEVFVGLFVVGAPVAAVAEGMVGPT